MDSKGSSATVAQAGDEVAQNKAAQLRTEWLKLMADWQNYKSKQPDTIKNLARLGCPSDLRPKIWNLLSDAQQVTQETKFKYQEMLAKSSNCEKLILRDVARTYPENDFFKDDFGPGQQRLFNVIKAYSLHDEEVGYCQGSAFIVGLLLLQLEEEETFVLLCKIMQDYKMREIYKPFMAELGLCIYQLECLVQEQLPELHVHFATQNYYTSMYSSSWFLTLFTSTFPLNLSYRIMDIFLAEGQDVIFKLSVSILQICKFDLLKLDMEGLLRYFQKEMPQRIEADIDGFIDLASKVKYDPKKMKKLCKTYTTINKKEQEEVVELRRLRTENRLLQDRLKALEQETKELADKLIKGQVCRAQEAEDNFVIKRELSQLRTSDTEKNALIEQSELKIKELENLLADRTINYSNEAQLLIHALQEELIAVKLRYAENLVEVDQLNKKIIEQELYIKSLRDAVPDDPIAQLEEELGAAKLREAESKYAMKELQSKFNELQTSLLEHLQQVHPNCSQPNSLEQSNSQSSNGSNSVSSGDPRYLQNSSLTNNTNNGSVQAQQQPSSLTMALANSLPLNRFVNSVIKRNSSLTNANSEGDPHQELLRLKEELLTLKLKEGNIAAEVQILRSREMELETQSKLQENKYRRKEDETRKIEEELKNEREKLAEVTNQLKEEQRKMTDMIWLKNEDQMMRRLKDVEHTRVIGELKQKISSLEIKIEEMNTSKKIKESGIEPKDALALQEQMAELQSESFRLEVSNKKLQDLEANNVKLEKVYNGNSFVNEF